MNRCFRFTLKSFFGIFLVFFAFSAHAQFDNNLTVGSRGEEIKKLQEFLIVENVYPEKFVTGYFGALTRAAVIRFQEKYAGEILAPLGLAKGTGFFGLMSRKKANINYRGSTSLLKIEEPASNLNYEVNYGGSTSIIPASIIPKQYLAPNPVIFENYKSYDGYNDYSEYGSPTPIVLGENFEISFKLRFTDSKLTTIIQRGSDSVDDKYWYVQTTSDGSGRLEFQISDGVGFALIQTATALNDGQWHEVVWSRAGDTHTVKVDGADKTRAGNIDSDIGDINSPKPIYIGGDPQNNENFFKGDIGDVKIILK